MTAHLLDWFRVASVNDLAEDRVTTVTPGNRSLCLSHFDRCCAAMDNRCPHQGGPLGEGSILLDNAQLAKIAKEQRAGEWPAWETSLHNRSFAVPIRPVAGGSDDRRRAGVRRDTGPVTRAASH